MFLLEDGRVFACGWAVDGQTGKSFAVSLLFSCMFIVTCSYQAAIKYNVCRNWFISKLLPDI